MNNKWDSVTKYLEYNNLSLYSKSETNGDVVEFLYLKDKNTNRLIGKEIYRRTELDTMNMIKNIEEELKNVKNTFSHKGWFWFNGVCIYDDVYTDYKMIKGESDFLINNISNAMFLFNTHDNIIHSEELIGDKDEIHLPFYETENDCLKSIIEKCNIVMNDPLGPIPIFKNICKTTINEIVVKKRYNKLINYQI